MYASFLLLLATCEESIKDNVSLSTFSRTMHLVKSEHHHLGFFQIDRPPMVSISMCWFISNLSVAASTPLKRKY